MPLTKFSMNYDIIHVEDEPSCQEIFEMCAEGQGLSYYKTSCLKGLEDALKDFSAHVYILDGNFPRFPEGNAVFLAPDAISLIRAHDTDARIFLYSCDESALQIANDNNVVYVNPR